MSAPRRLTDQQRAAHLLLPMVGELLKTMNTEATQTEGEAKRARKRHDSSSDWTELAIKARARAEGASRVAAMIQAVARG